MNQDSTGKQSGGTESTLAQDVQSVLVDSIPYEEIISVKREEKKSQTLKGSELSIEQKLLSAAQCNEKYELLYLLQNNPNIDVSRVINQKQFTLLHFTSFNNQYEIIVKLIDHYRNYLIVERQAQTLNICQYVNLQTSDGFSAVHFAAYRGNILLMDYFHGLGADLLLTNEHGMNILHIAAQGDQPISVMFAHQHGISINTLDNKGGSPLHWSCFNGCEQSTIFLLTLLPDTASYYPLNLLDQQLLSPLHLAVMSGNTRLVKKLLTAGADKNLRGKENKTPADMALDNDYKNINLMLVKEDSVYVEYCNIKQGYKRQRKTSIELLRFITILSIEVGTYIIFVVGLDFEQFGSELIQIITLAMIVLLTLVFVFIVYYDPGYMQYKKKPILELLKHNECYEVCPHCSCVKLPRSKHCDICQRCVYVYDHHCPWINNCIGAKNHGIFVFFIFLLISVFILQTVQVVQKIMTLDRNSLENMLEYIFLSVNLLISLLFTIALIILGCTQSINLLSGKTTLERFAFKTVPNSLSSALNQTSSQKSLKTSLLAEEANKSQGKMKLSFRNCFQMCYSNQREFREKERSIKLS